MRFIDFDLKNLQTDNYFLIFMVFYQIDHSNSYGKIWKYRRFHFSVECLLWCYILKQVLFQSRRVFRILSSRFKMQEFPLLKSLKERIYLGTEVITKMQHEYIFTKRCWATPSVDSQRWETFSDLKKYVSSNIAYSPIIDNGCPSDAFTSLQPRSNHEDRFSTETLRFPESNYVYIQVTI